jgi:hypothetical protein
MIAEATEVLGVYGPTRGPRARASCDGSRGRVILALAGLWQLDPASDWSAQAQRIYDIVLGGLQIPA